MGKPHRPVIQPWRLIISPDGTDFPECSTLACSQTKPQDLYLVPISATQPPENLETCLSASISENIRLLFTSLFPSPLFFLPQQTKSQAFSTLLRLHRTKTQKMGLCPVWASRRLGSLTAGPSSSYSLSCNSIQMALAFTRSFFAAMLRVLFIWLWFLEF